LNIFLIIPASIGISLILQNIFRGKSVTTVLFIFSLAFALLVGPVFKPLKIIYRSKLYLLDCEFPAPVKELLNWFAENTTPEGRILIEDSEFDTGHQYYGTHLPALFPEYVKREYLCGPRPMYPIQQSYASFTAGLLFEKKVSEYSLDELKQQFNLYNVKWIVSWSEESKKVFNQFPEYLTKMKEIDKFTVYEVNRVASFFLKGRGTIISDYNHLELRDVMPEDGEIIIAYHWMEKLKPIPDAKMERVFVSNDPVGFIKIKGPPKNLILVNNY
jgi:hypothetical protein